nr:Gldg family protein [Desulfobulbus alkaliphilus]
MHQVVRRELAAFFATPAAFIFLAAFIGVTLFVFFWVETFFSRNIADVRPLFAWMPLLLIFLVAAITMRVWSEEHRTGTLESLLTAPVRPSTLVLGKFLACLALVAIGLVLTFPLPVTVSLLGQLDWGPVFGGYLASLILAATYIAIGLFISARCNSQIVSLIGTTLVCGLLYLLGSDTLTGFFSNRGGEVLKLLGAGSRFEAITRGVIDLRDIVYYLSLCGIFLTLNLYGLERRRWAGNPANAAHRRWGVLTSLLILNFLLVNIWLAPIGSLRADLTEGRIYSISTATRSYLERLQEPLLIRGYFSAQTHPLLAPLQPQLRDLLREYQVAGGGKVRVEFIDPQQRPELEQEAGEKYGIRPVPFQTASRHQTAVTNSYFDVLIKYGDAFVTLGFQDLIEVKSEGDTQLEVALRNPEHDITRAVKKVLYSYQGEGDLFAGLDSAVVFYGYFSAEHRLPQPLVELKDSLEMVLADMEDQAGGFFSFHFIDPEADGGAVARQLTEEYGMQPMVADPLSSETFWFYLILASDDQVVQVALPSALDRVGLKTAVEAGLKRFSSGMLKTVGLSVPTDMSSSMAPFGMMSQGATYQLLQQFIELEHRVRMVDLDEGQVALDVDILVLVAPEQLTEVQVFAVDQFLMQGGTVVLATSPFDLALTDGLQVRAKESGLTAWLSSHGLSLTHAMVLDPQNAAFPVPVERHVGSHIVEETHLINYPYFIDIRSDGMDRDSGLTTGIDQIAMTWASPILIDPELNRDRRLVHLLESSPGSWLSDSVAVHPDFERYGATGFSVGQETGRQLVAVMVEGVFTSWFADRASPLVAAAQTRRDQSTQPGSASMDEAGDEMPPVIDQVLLHSPDSARIILLASSSFLADISLELASGASGSRYLNPLQLVANCIDWSLEDRELLGIRGRSHFARTLLPMSSQQRAAWEYVNYGLAGLGLLMVWGVQRLLMVRSRRRYRALLAGESEE